MRTKAVGPEVCRNTAALSAPRPLRSKGPLRSATLYVQSSAAASGDRPTSSGSAAAPGAGAGSSPADAGSLRAHAHAQPNVLPLSSLGKGLERLRIDLGLASGGRQAPTAAEAQAHAPDAGAPALPRGGVQADPPSWPTAAARQGLYSDVPVERVRGVVGCTCVEPAGCGSAIGHGPLCHLLCHLRVASAALAGLQQPCRAFACP